MSNESTIYDRAIEAIRAKSTGLAQTCQFDITINFHPDRLTTNGKPLLVAIARDLAIKSQFETQTSNGGLSAFVGGDRWQWEQSVFDGVYDECEAWQRPKYGALNYRQLRAGGSPRFGSCCFRLKPHVLKRATFCYPDSHMQPEHFATAEHLPALIERANNDSVDALDSYIEAQIHGPIHVREDVDALVLDPAFKDTEIEQQAAALPLSLEWHSGFELSIQTITENPEYRGQAIVDLAQHLADNGHLNPALLGHAIKNSDVEPQQLKKLWHYLAKFSE